MRMYHAWKQSGAGSRVTLGLGISISEAWSRTCIASDAETILVEEKQTMSDTYSLREAVDACLPTGCRGPRARNGSDSDG